MARLLLCACAALQIREKQTVALHPLQVRRMDFDFTTVPKYWNGGNPIATHLLDGVNLLLPAGERFFIRSVNHYFDRIEDRALQAQVRAFFGQEGLHAKEHVRASQSLALHGYKVNRILRAFEGFLRLLERILPAPLRLAATAACEHLTASMAEEVLAHDRLRHAHPAMADLLKWHVAEEIEHKAVAYDVLQLFAPSYLLRVFGLILATTMLWIFWTAGTLSLIRQDHLSWRELRAANADMKRVRPFSPWMLIRALGQFLRPSFHPWNNNNLALSKQYFESIDRWEG
jgi:predicted metal-dependent hydrolase